ncbi:MAG: phosphoribosyltransferase family protein, partial [Tepidimonas sp.]
QRRSGQPVGLAFIEKRRSAGRVSGSLLAGEVRGATALLIDDLIATGGTMMAGKKLLEKLGATVTEGAAIVALPELGGLQRLHEAGLPLFTLVSFEGH